MTSPPDTSSRVRRTNRDNIYQAKRKMKYIQFDNTKLPNLEYSLFKEILQTNRAGGYMSTSIIGCNTRKYHGLLVCPLEEFGGESFVMLSSMQCSLELSGQEKLFNLGVQEYKGEYFEPKGHKYMIGYTAEPTSTMTYRVGGVMITQQYVLAENESQIMIRYTVDEASEKFTMRLKPFLAFRSIHALTQENMALNTRYEEVDGGVKFHLYESLPSLYIQGNKKMEFVGMPDWYRDVEYIKERYRGYGYREDLYVPGYFELELKEGDSFVISASLNETASKGLKTKFTREVGNRNAKDSMKNMLINAAQQFIQHNADGTVMLKAGYHWKMPQLRDMFVALPGLAIFQKDKKVYEEILKTSIPNLRRLYIKDASLNNTSIDIPLWFFNCVNELERYFGKTFKTSDYYDVMKEIVELYWEGIPGKMSRLDNGLLYARQEGHAQTWMNSTTSNGTLVTPRYGCAVEVNALWYNAIATALEVAKGKKDKKFAETWEPRLEQVRRSFEETFVNGVGYLYDYVDNNYKSLSLRPNMVIAAGLKNSPLTREQKKEILDFATKELLTPRGLRSLSPNDPKYKGAIEGGEDERALAQHQGTAYPWLLGFYADAMIDVHRNTGISQIRRIVEGMEPELQFHCIGTLSEQYNGNPPFSAKGAISMAWNVAAMLKLINIIEPK